MQAKDYPLASVLQERQQWVIPVYQRTYSWRSTADGQIPNLWNDLRDRAMERLDGRPPKPHFVGAIIYAEPAEQPFGTVNKRFLVDGQQRITTFSLTLCALRECARDAGVERLVHTANEYLFNAQSASMADPTREKFKLWSSSYDRPLYTIIAEKTALEVAAAFPQHFYKNGNIVLGQAPKVLAAYWVMKDAIAMFIKEREQDGVKPEAVLDAIVAGFLGGFQIVVVQLGQTDDAQAIFASLNGKAEPLTSFDLIRNDIFHRARKSNEDDDALYETHWKSLENSFWKEEVKQGRLKRPRTDHLLTHTMVAETAQDIIVGQVANEYHRFAKERAFATVEEEVQALTKYAAAYREMEERKQGGSLARIAEFLSIWDSSVMHPVVLWSAVNDMDEAERTKLFHHLESYVVRRDLCRMPNANYNRVVASLLTKMHKDSHPYQAFLQQICASDSETARFPTDSDVTRSIVSKPIYDALGSKKLRYILSRIEAGSRDRFDEIVSVDTTNLTVEHIMPSRWAQHWPLPCGEYAPGEDYFDILTGPLNVSESVRREMEARQVAKQTLGNLTLLTSSLNPSLGNGPWSDKRESLRKSLLALNRDAAEHDVWDEASIERRSLNLAKLVNKIWPYPEAVTASESLETVGADRPAKLP